MRVFAGLVVCCALVVASGCGSSSESAASQDARHAAHAADRREEAEATASECDPNYTGACLDPNAVDYDCAGGSGNGPEYTGPVTVVGEDHYGLDADGDGRGCE